MKTNATKQTTVAFAVPLSIEEPMNEAQAQANVTETEKRMLLFRLSDAASRIRDEANLIRRTGFGDASGRLLRILNETVEEQRQALSDSSGGATK